MYTTSCIFKIIEFWNTNIRDHAVGLFFLSTKRFGHTWGCLWRLQQVDEGCKDQEIISKLYSMLRNTYEQKTNKFYGMLRNTCTNKRLFVEFITSSGKQYDYKGMPQFEFIFTTMTYAHVIQVRAMKSSNFKQ